MEEKVWIIGHKNPDTDSICAAIAYADLKNQIDDTKVYEPKRAGELNEETRYVLDTFQVQEPELVTDAGAQLSDIEIRKTAGVDPKISLKKAWGMMQENKINTLPVTDEKNSLTGLITIRDIATSYMDVYDERVLAKARTQYKNIIETLDGKILCGNEHAYFTSGKVIVGSANPEIMETYIDTDDLVIMGSRYEAEVCAIEAGVACIVITGNPSVSNTIIRLAQEHDCVLICTPMDTFTTVRMINQSMPVKFFMRTNHLITFEIDDYLDDVREVMSKERHRDFPILDSNGKYLGMISRRNLLNMRRKQVILVDHNEHSQAVDGIDGADILEIIDHHRIGSLQTLAPVLFRNQPVGCTATIVYQMYQENNVSIRPEIAGLLLSAILSDTLMFRSPTCTPLDRQAAEVLAKIADVNIEEHAIAMFTAGSDFKGKTAEEIFYQDFKKFQGNDVDFGVGQLSAMTQEEMVKLRETLTPYLPTVLMERQLKLVFVMLTNIIEETTYLICDGEGADELVESAYQLPKDKDGWFVLKGVVSRKKQLIPKLMAALNEQ